MHSQQQMPPLPYAATPLPSLQQMGYPLYLHQHVLHQPQPRQKQGPSPNPETRGEHCHPSHQTGKELLQHPI